MSDEQVDAVTGATPKESGIQTYTWDFMDADGKDVPAGDYKIYLEATLYFLSKSLSYRGLYSSFLIQIYPQISADVQVLTGFNAV